MSELIETSLISSLHFDGYRDYSLQAFTRYDPSQQPSGTTQFEETGNNKAEIQDIC